ncbi:hypothetical protein ACUOAQ_21030, partial [Escherichia sp. SP-MK]
MAGILFIIEEMRPQ